MMSIMVIIFTLMFNEQMNYWLHTDLGFNKNNVMVIESDNPEVLESLSTFKNEILVNSDISAVARSRSMVGTGFPNTNIKIENSKGELVNLSVAHSQVDYDFVGLMEMEIVEGRSFSREMSTDRMSAVLVNETLVKEMGWKDSPIGKKIQLSGETRVIGVLKDFHYELLYYRLNPMILFIGEKGRIEKLPVIQIKIDSDNIKETIKFIKGKWKELNPMQPFEYRFLDDSISNQYTMPNSLNKITNCFAFLCTFISCLGLFGLSSFIGEKRTKEIGIRKVYGASVWNVFYHLSLDFLKLVLISGLIAAAISYYVIDELMWRAWIYTPAINLWEIYAVAACIALFITLVTVSYYAVKASLTDPVKALLYE